jgi:hypothetical protein
MNRTLRAGPELSCLLGELPAVHAAHDDISHHHVNADCGVIEIERTRRVGRRDDMITEVAERLDHIAPQKVVVLDH